MLMPHALIQVLYDYLHPAVMDILIHLRKILCTFCELLFICKCTTDSITITLEHRY